MLLMLMFSEILTLMLFRVLYELMKNVFPATYTPPETPPEPAALAAIPIGSVLAAAIERIWKHCAQRHSSVLELLRSTDHGCNNTVQFSALRNKLKSLGCFLDRSELASLQQYLGADDQSLLDVHRVIEQHAKSALPPPQRPAPLERPETPAAHSQLPEELPADVVRCVAKIQRQAERKGQSLVFLCRHFDMGCKGFLSGDELRKASASVGIQDGAITQPVIAFMRGEVGTAWLLEMIKSKHFKAVAARVRRPRPRTACGYRRSSNPQVQVEAPPSNPTDWRCSLTGGARKLLLTLNEPNTPYAILSPSQELQHQPVAPSPTVRHRKKYKPRAKKPHQRHQIHRGEFELQARHLDAAPTFEALSSTYQMAQTDEQQWLSKAFEPPPSFEILSLTNKEQRAGILSEYSTLLENRLREVEIRRGFRHS